MTDNEIPERLMPLWVKVLIVVCSLPVLAFPALMNRCAPETTAELLLWCYPFYVVLSAVLEWRCWGRRRELTWVLLFIMLLTHAAMWILVDPAIILP